MSDHTRPFRALLAATLGIAGAAVGAVPASARVLNTDHPRVTAQDHDFGLHWTLGAPRDGGTLTWDLTRGVTTAHVTGYHYLADGVDGRVRMDFYDEDHDWLGERHTSVHHAPGSGKAQWWVDTSFSSTVVTHVHVSVQRENNGGSFTTVASVLDYFD